MRRNRYDPFVLFFIIGFFVYCFFIAGVTPVYWGDGELGLDGVFHRSDEVRYHEYSTGILVLPLFFLAVFILYVFSDELEGYSIRRLFFILRRLKK